MDQFETMHTCLNILKMCMWAFDGAKFNFDRSTVLYNHLACFCIEGMEFV